MLTLPVDLSILRKIRSSCRLCGVTRAWGERAGWRSDWQRAAGDEDEDIFARTTVNPDRLAGTLRIPNGIVPRESLQGEELSGALATLAPYSRRGLSTAQLMLLANVATAHVAATWTPGLPTRPQSGG